MSSRGWCNTHYERWRLKGSTDDPERTPETCTVEGCENPHKAKGWCNKHYRKWKSYGDPTGGRWETARGMRDAFDLRTKWSEGGCLEWTAARDRYGYGRQQFRGGVWLAHRVAWTLVNGEIPEGLEVNHKCWNPACVNVEHLNLATRSENMAYLQGPNSEGTSGFRNVHWDPKSETWYTRVVLRGKVRTRTGFTTPEAAAKYAGELREELFGEFAGKG